MMACDNEPPELARNSFTSMGDPAGSGAPAVGMVGADRLPKKKRNGDLMSGAARAAGRRHAGSGATGLLRVSLRSGAGRTAHRSPTFSELATTLGMTAS